MAWEYPSIPSVLVSHPCMGNSEGALFCSVCVIAILVSLQFNHSVVSDSLRPHEPQHARPPCRQTNSQSPPKLISIELVMPSNHLILCHPLLLPPSIFPNIRVFSNESALRMRWPKYWSFSFSISPSIEHPGLITFRMDWLNLLAVQGTLKSLLQYHSSKASILQCSAFFIVQLSHPYMTTGKTTALTRQTFVGKVMSLLFNMHHPTYVGHCIMLEFSLLVLGMPRVQNDHLDSSFISFLPFFFFFFWPHLMAFGILVSQPVIEPGVEMPSPNHWTTREVPATSSLYLQWQHSWK